MTPHSESTNPPSSRSAAEAQGRRGRRYLAIVSIVGLTAVAGASWYAGFRSSHLPAAGVPRTAGPPSDATPVVVTAARRGNLDIYLVALGTVTPLNAVTVRGRVDGQLMSIAFEEGQMVNEGDLLAQIDPRPFEVQLTLAKGQLARDQALLDKARADLERYRTLLAQDSISGQQVDTQESLVRQYMAAVQGSQGGVDNARLQLAYTRVTAPISGRVGLRQISPGNVVRVSDAGGIVAITQLQPVGVVFPIPEDTLPGIMKQLRTPDRIPVEAYDRAQKQKLGKGRLVAADNQIDTATGTIKLKAEFPNAEGALFANQFVNVRLPIETRAKAILVPTAAIQHGAAGTFVYVVKDDKTVVVTPVKTGPTQGETTAIDAGVSAGAMVVIDGADRLRDGARVLVRTMPAAQPVARP